MGGGLGEGGDVLLNGRLELLQLKRKSQYLDQLLQLLPATAKLRLDANGGLSLEEAKEWVKGV